MRNLLIVDDEKQIRLGLKAMIEKKYPSGYAIRIAADGGEALQAYDREPADLVITDIRMPGMDGIALIQHLQSREKRPSVLILSGYNDFQYAKEAIKCEVKDYLLKPIVREELYAAIERIEREMGRQEEISRQLGESEQTKERLRASELNYIFLNDALDEDEIAAICGRIGIEPFPDGYYVGLIRFAGGERRGMVQDAFGSRIRFLAEEFKSAYGGRELLFSDKDDQLVLIAERRELYAYLAEQTSGSGLLACTIGLSTRADELRHIRKRYLEAGHALKYRIIYPKSPLISYESVQDRKANEPVPAEPIRKLYNLLGTNRDKEMKALLQELLDIRKIALHDIAYAEGISEALNAMVFDEVFRLYGEESVHILKFYKVAGNLYNFGSIQEYARAAEELLLRLDDYVYRVKSLHSDNDEMRKAVEYIRDHYDEDLNMSVVSNFVSLNYSYFSQAFKAYTGENFVQYLKKLRIAKAKELLAATDAKVYEIGERVGFRQSKHFHRAFKEIEGISANEYRGQYRDRQRQSKANERTGEE